MWRFMKNIEPPKKKPKTDNEKRTVRQNYDQNKRQRSFQKSWLDHKDFKPWLRYDNASKLMFCTICEDRATTGDVALCKTEFIKGCASLRIESLHKHVASEFHNQTAAIRNAKEAAPGTSEAARCLRQLNAVAYNRLECFFRTSHALAKHGRPFSDFLWMTELDSKKGLDVGETYKNRKKCREFTDAIAEVERQKLEKRVSDSKFLAVMCDEATDAAVVEQLILFIRYAKDGVVKSSFLAIQQLERATAENCYAEILNALHEQLGIKEADVWTKLIGFGSDGASVMTGRKSGVGARLKEHQPVVQTVHCIAHRLELAIKNAAKKVPMFQKLDQLLLSLFLFYHNSTLNRGLLRRTAEALGVKRFIPTRTGGTRWIGHTQTALNNLLSGYPAIIQHLLEIKDHNKTSADSKGKSAGFIKLLLSRTFLEFIHFVVDITSILSILSRTFQKRDMNMSSIPKLVDDTIHSLEKLKTQHGPALRKFRQAVSTETFHGMDIIGEPLEDTICQQLIVSLVDSVRERFDTGDQLTANVAKIINFKSWPIEAEGDFGDVELAQLVDFYGTFLEGAGVDANLIEVEWQSLKNTIYKDFNPVCNATWPQMCTKYKEDAPNFLMLVDLLLTIPAHSVECERGFSHMKRVKNDWRNKLKNTALTSILRIILESPTQDEFNPDQAINYWNNASLKSRRPFQPPYGPRRVIPDDNDQDDDDQDGDESEVEKEE